MTVLPSRERKAWPNETEPLYRSGPFSSKPELKPLGDPMPEEEDDDSSAPARKERKEKIVGRRRKPLWSVSCCDGGKDIAVDLARTSLERGLRVRTQRRRRK